MPLSPPPGVSTARVALALAAVYVIWGSTYYGMRVALETLPPLGMSGLRFVVAGGLLYLLERVAGRPRPSARQWGASALVGVLLLGCGNGGVAIAIQYGGLSSGLAAVMVASMPLWAALAAALFPRLGGAGARPAPLEWVGLVVGFAGTAWLGLRGGGVRFTPAGLAILVSPICWAVGSVWSRRAPLPDGLLRTATQMLVGGLFLLAVAAGFGERWPAAASTRSLVAWGYLVVLGSMVAFSAYTFLLRATRPALATSYSYVNPLVAVAIGAGLGGERFTVEMGAATLVVVGSVALLATRPRAASPSTANGSPVAPAAPSRH